MTVTHRTSGVTVVRHTGAARQKARKDIGRAGVILGK